MYSFNMMYVVDSSEWDNVVSTTYNREYNFQQDGCRERGVRMFTVPCGDYDFDNDSVNEIADDDEMGCHLLLGWRVIRKNL